MTVPRIDILGVPVDCIDMKGALAWVDYAVSSPGNKRIMAINPEKVMAARCDHNLLEFIKQSDLLVPDGIGVVIAARILGLAHLQRVPGADLMQTLCAHAAQHGLRIFLYGARPEVNAKSLEILKNRYPGIRIVGASHGYLPGEKMDILVDEINRSQADILFIALGSPRQEKWMQEFGPRLRVRISQGIGGTLDTIVGTVRRAPPVFQKLHLEWFFRLITQPSRAKRQAVLPLFMLLVVQARLLGRNS
jgi:N-acetylglucosaminyldiphosphoundecaprenol N-acetyl-beta-D-mannosaminyltransferase